MSYCRFGEADAYIFENVGGWLECCGCWFSGTYRAWTSRAMLVHIERHRKVGDFIPLKVDLRIFRNFPMLDKDLKTGKIDYMQKKSHVGPKHRGRPSAYKVRDLADWRGTAALYELSVPIDDIRYVVVSAVDLDFSDWLGVHKQETMVFASNEKGTVKDYVSLARINYMSHVDVLYELGYVVEDKKPEDRPSVEEFWKWLDDAKKLQDSPKKVINEALNVLTAKLAKMSGAEDSERQLVALHIKLLLEPIRWSESSKLEILEDDFPVHTAIARFILQER